MADRVVLYHYPASLCSQKVRLALAEKGMPYMSRVIDIGPRLVNYEPWYIQLNPRGVVPTLVHNGLVVTDSAQIMRYIDSHLPGPSLTPERAEDREHAEAWLRRQDAFSFRELTYDALLHRAAPVSIDNRIRRLRQQIAAHPALTDAYMARIEDLKQWRRAQTAPETMGAMTTSLERLLDDLEEHLRTRRFIGGLRCSLADVAWTVLLARVEMIKRLDLIEARPNLRAYYARQRNRPSFEEANLWDRPKPKQLAPYYAAWAAPRLLLAGALGVSAALLWRAWRGSAREEGIAELLLEAD